MITNDRFVRVAQGARICRNISQGRLALRRIILPLLAGLISSGALATEPDNRDRVKLPKLEDVKPLNLSDSQKNAGLLHDFSVFLTASSSRYSNKNQPLKGSTDTDGATVGVQFGIGRTGFAGLSVTENRQHSSTVIFPGTADLPLRSTNTDTGWNLIVGLRPLPYLFVGLMGGEGKGDSQYQFTSFPNTPVSSDSSSRRYGGFVGTWVPVGKVMLMPSLSYLTTENNQKYPAGNAPATNAFGATFLLANVDARYDVTGRFQVFGNITHNTVLDEQIAVGSVGMASSWQTLGVGANYKVTDKLGISARYITWISNERADYRSFSAGLNYKF